MVNFKVGDVIIFTDEVTREEFDASPGIKARIIAVDKSEDYGLDHCVKVFFDVSEFVEYNKNKWEAIYFDDAGNPTLTYPEKSWYDPKISYYFDETEAESGKYFKIAESEIKVDLEFVVSRLKELHKEYSDEYLNYNNKYRRQAVDRLMSDFGIKV